MRHARDLSPDELAAVRRELDSAWPATAPDHFHPDHRDPAFWTQENTPMTLDPIALNADAQQAFAEAHRAPTREADQTTGNGDVRVIENTIDAETGTGRLVLGRGGDA